MAGTKQLKVLTDGRYRSMRLEDAIADGLKDIADREGLDVAEVLALLNERYQSRRASNFTAHVRMLVLAYYRLAAAEACGIQEPPGPGIFLARALEALDGFSSPQPPPRSGEPHPGQRHAAQELNDQVAQTAICTSI